MVKITPNANNWGYFIKRWDQFINGYGSLEI